MVPIWSGDKRLFLCGTRFLPASVHNFPWVAWMKYTYKEGIPIPLAKDKLRLFVEETISWKTIWLPWPPLYALTWVWQVLFLQVSFLKFCGNAPETFVSLQLNKKSQVSAFVTIFLHQEKKKERKFLLKTSSNHWRQTTWNSSMKVFSNHPFREFRQKVARDIRLVL